MCGICGYINLDKKPVKDPAVIKDMVLALRHRGPDDEGFFIKDNVAMGHARLSVIDLETGHQPLFSPDGDLAIVYNGEAYNFPELKKALSAKGYRFGTTSDTEVVLEAFKEWGRDSFLKINGMFSLAVWDERNKKLMLARDKFGKKPLYYGRFGNVFIFASEIKSILKHPSVKREMDTRGMLKYFAHDYIPSPSTIFKNIFKLEAGCAAELDGTGFKKYQYWNLSFGDKNTAEDRAFYENKYRDLLSEAVGKRLISDVPLGVFLSGGMDSSSVVAMMSKHMKGPDIKTFTIGYKDRHFDESGDARIVARHFNTDHYEEIISPKDMLKAMPLMLSLMDEPFADSSIIPTYLVSRFARKHVTVALGGDGGDEFFAGYPSFIAHKISRALRGVPFSRQLLTVMQKAVGGSSSYMSMGFKLRRYLRGMDYPEDIRHQVWIGSFPLYEQKKLLSENFGGSLNQESLYDESFKYMDEAEGLNYIDKVNYLYAKTYMTDDILTKVDRASMAVGLEVRAPFLDPDFIEFAVSVPARLKLKGFNTKYIAKKAMAPLLPREILRKAKHGFAVPVGSWFRNELRELIEDNLNEKRIKEGGIFEFEYIKHILNSHLSGKVDFSRELWSLLAFQLWRRIWLLNEKNVWKG